MCGSLLHSSSSPTVRSLLIYLYLWYPLIINSTEEQKQPSAEPSDTTQLAWERVKITLDAVVYSNLFYVSISN